MAALWPMAALLSAMPLTAIRRLPPTFHAAWAAAAAAPLRNSCISNAVSRSVKALTSSSIELRVQSRVRRRRSPAYVVTRVRRRARESRRRAAVAASSCPPADERRPAEEDLEPRFLAEAERSTRSMRRWPER